MLFIYLINYLFIMESYSQYVQRRQQQRLLLLLLNSKEKHKTTINKHTNV